jgi:RNA polymerase sigma-70 factor (ECF subfamily)
MVERLRPELMAKSPREQPVERPTTLDPASFAADLSLVAWPALRLARSFGLSVEAASDAVQDAALQAWRFREARRGEFRPWFLAIVARRARRQSIEWLPLPWHLTADRDWPARVDARDHIEVALRRLRSRQRAVLLLRYGDDLPIRDIAEIMKLSEPAAKQLLLRARISLKQAIDAIERGDQK